MLTFLGRGSAFCAENNCAYYTDGSRLVMFDCPMSAFQRLKQAGPDRLAGGRKVESITVLITHTHSDHAGGIGMLVHYCCYVLDIPVEIVAPSEDVAEDIRLILLRLEGCSKDAFRIIAPGQSGTGFVPVPTTHSPELSGRCFGWYGDIGGKRVVYTGDTNTLEPFLPCLTDGAYLYTEASAYDSPVHLYISKLEKIIPGLTARGIKVYLMHLDDEEKLADAADKLGAELAPLFSE